jgi:hypothetical protein
MRVKVAFWIRYTYSNGNWSTETQVSQAAISTVSCSSASFCEAVDTSANAYDFKNATWSSSVQIGTAGENNITSISCPAPNFCMAVDSTGQAFIFSGQSWSAESQAAMIFIRSPVPPLTGVRSRTITVWFTYIPESYK